jgi:hypothetical protein
MTGFAIYVLSPGDRYHCREVGVVSEERRANVRGKFNRVVKISDASIPSSDLFVVPSSAVDPFLPYERPRCRRRSHGVLSCTYRRSVTHARPRDCQQGGRLCDIDPRMFVGVEDKSGLVNRRGVVLATAKTEHHNNNTVPQGTNKNRIIRSSNVQYTFHCSQADIPLKPTLIDVWAHIM